MLISFILTSHRISHWQNIQRSGTDTVESDIDLFILTDEKGKIRAKLNKYGSGTERRISAIIVDPSALPTMKSKDKALYERIMSGIVLWQAE